MKTPVDDHNMVPRIAINNPFEYDFCIVCMEDCPNLRTGNYGLFSVSKMTQYS